MAFVEKLKSLSKYGIVTAFFAMEVFAFLAFSFGSSFILFGSLSLGLLVLLLIFTFAEININGFTRAAYLLFPIFIFSLLTGLGTYMRAHQAVGDFNVAELVFVPVGIISIYLCGYLLANNKSFKISTFLLVIFSALALLVVINLIVNLINFGAFHTIIYRGYYMYYGGKRSDVPVNEMAYALEGFKFIEVKVDYYSMYPLLLLTSSFFLMNLRKDKANNKYFIIAYCLFTSIALLALIFVPTLRALVYVIAILVVEGFIILFKKTKTPILPFKIILYVLIGLMALVFLIMFLNCNVSSIHSSIASNGTLNKLFNTNGYAKTYNLTLYDLFSKGSRFLGYATGPISYGSSIYEEVHLTGSVLFDNMMTSGLIGNILFFIIIAAGLIGFKKYPRNEDSDFVDFGTLLTFVIAFIFIIMLTYNGEYGVFTKIYRPAYMTGPFMIFIFIISYVFNNKSAIEVKQTEVINNEEIKY